MGRTDKTVDGSAPEPLSLAESILQRVECDLNDPAVMESSNQWCANSDIAHFYSGKHVLVTGATGFLGTVLVEKLLRSCPDIGALYLIVRPKKGLNVHQRVEKIFNGELFDTLRR